MGWILLAAIAVLVIGSYVLTLLGLKAPMTPPPDDDYTRTRDYLDHTRDWPDKDR